jgi:hypothetical protein
VAIRTASRQPSFERPTDAAALLRAPRGDARFLDVPERRFFMIDGRGAPGSDAFRAAFNALYPVAYTLHFALKRRGVVAPVGALEGLYWLDGDRPLHASLVDATPVDPAVFNWRLMLPVPEAATDAEIAAAIDDVRRKKAPPALPKLRAEAWREGHAAQVLHVGPYDAEGPTLKVLDRAIEARGLRLRGHHHEVYISDPNRTPPERLKTIIRIPVEIAA